MNIKDLVGEHVLTGVDMQGVGPEWSADWLRFCLDGKIYIAEEDPDDGYRSYLGELREDLPETMMVNVFTPCPVTVRISSRDDELLEMVDHATGQVVLEIGTDNSEDYYPCCVLGFHPEAMACNIGK